MAFEPEHDQSTATEKLLWPRVLAYYGSLGNPGSIPPTVMQTVTARNIPAQTIALETGATVVDGGGEDVGRFWKVLTTESGAPTHVVVDRPGLAHSPKAIPISWIDSISEDVVEVAAPEAVIDRIPDYAEA